MHNIAQRIAAFEQAGALDHHDGFGSAEIQPGCQRPRLALATDLYQIDFWRGAQGIIPLAERGVRDPHHMCNAQLRQRGNKFFRREHVMDSSFAQE